MITRDTKYSYTAQIVPPSDQDAEVVYNEHFCDTDTLMYSCPCDVSSYLTLYDASHNVINRQEIPVVNSVGLRGGNINVTYAATRIVVGPHVTLYKRSTVTVGDLIDNAESLDNLYSRLDTCRINDGDAQAIVSLYLYYTINRKV